MNKKYGDIGGTYSDKMIKDLGRAIEKLADCERTIQFFEGAQELSEEQTEELLEAKDAYANIQFNIANMDRDLEVMYANSADAKAEEHMIKWFVLQTAHYYETVAKDGKQVKELFPLFDGNTASYFIIFSTKIKINFVLINIHHHFLEDILRLHP